MSSIAQGERVKSVDDRVTIIDRGHKVSMSLEGGEPDRESK
ncbi:hypothetical protein VFA_001708 [Vibrio furnissii CIP 102972]|nr:hypothetical protein VFA_001708 [Vibrio furnissii CIP 102972]